MELALNVTNQIIIMFLLLGVGILIYKLKFFSDETIKQLNNFLMVFIVSASVLESFILTDFTFEKTYNLIFAIIFAVIFHLLAILISSFVFGTKTLNAKTAVLSSIYSNCGFMALPLLNAIFGSDGIFYGSAYICVFNAFLWGYASPLLQDSNKTSFSENMKIVAKNPVIITIFVSFIVYLLNFNIPSQLTSVVSYLSSLNTPLAMILVGIFVAKCKSFDCFKQKSFYMIILMRLIILPLIFLGVLTFIAFLFNVDNTVILCSLIASSCPIAGSIAMMCERYNIDTSFSVQLLTFCTLASIITIPLMIYIAQSIPHIMY